MSAPYFGTISSPIIVVIQNDISLSITVDAALIEAEIPDDLYSIIMNPSIAPSPPGSSGIIPTSDDTMNISPTRNGETVHPNARNTTYTLSISIAHIRIDNGSPIASSLLFVVSVLIVDWNPVTESCMRVFRCSGSLFLNVFSAIFVIQFVTFIPNFSFIDMNIMMATTTTISITAIIIIARIIGDTFIVYISEIIVIIASSMNGTVSSALSVTTVAKDCENVSSDSFDSKYALTGSPPPLPLGVMLFTARLKSTIGSNCFSGNFLSSDCSMNSHLKVYRKYVITCSSIARSM